MARPNRLLGGVILGVALIGGYLTMRGVPEPQATPTPTPLSPPPFEEGSPAGALHAYLEGDFAGERLERASWSKYKHMVLWPTEPKWDSAYVIRSFRVESGPITGRKSSAEATFDTMGELDLDRYTYTASPTRQRVPYELVTSTEGWVLGTPTLRPHVGPEAAIAFLKRMRVGFPTLRGAIDASIKAIDEGSRAQP